MKVWEAQQLAKRTEYTKTSSILNEDKQRFINQLISEDSERSLDDIDHALKVNGFYGNLSSIGPFLPYKQ